MDLPHSPRLLLLGTLLVLAGFMAVLAIGRLAAEPGAMPVACGDDCTPRPWLDPEKASRFASVFRQ
jgi:hypothetical protein